AVARLTGAPSERADDAAIHEERAPYAANGTGGGASGWVAGDPREFDRTHLLDVPALLRFLQTTEPRAVEQLGLAEPGPKRDAFLQRLSAEIAKRGVIDVLRRGVAHHHVASLALFYGAPTPGNLDAAAKHAANEFRVTRQVRYSQDETARALDLVLFVNGLPLATFELKNQLTQQNVEDAVRQYQRDRNPNEPLFKPGRCAVHFAVDENNIRYCTELRGKDSVFLPFDRGYQDGAGNPPNPRGLRTDWLWDETLAPPSLTDIIENYAQRVVEKDANGKKRVKHLWPRYHQLDAVRKLLADAAAQGPGRRYLIEHSAGSGKSNTIAWLVHQLIDLQSGDGRPAFDTVVVVTDRIILDRQLRETIAQFTTVGATVGAAGKSGELR
ncbi:MAG TPA: type I restriction endonuclease, partial [Thermomicrobiales bacterium]|nr:type I restriction endonuclease [Thermomicrobiales bacterium]